jgi:hypothetical protein
VTRSVDHWRVEPSDAVGMSVRVPVEQLAIVAELVAPHVPRARVTSQSSFVTLYATVGGDLLNGRRVAHRWANVISDPPAGVPPERGIGGIAYVGPARTPVGRLWARVGQVIVPGRVALAIDRSRRRAVVRIATGPGRLRAVVDYPATGTPWEFLPQTYCLMDPALPIAYRGNEWGVAHDGVGIVEFTGPTGARTFEAEISVDLEVGWDYTFEPHALGSG